MWHKNIQEPYKIDLSKESVLKYHTPREWQVR